jgi:hypothetical protein
MEGWWKQACTTEAGIWVSPVHVPQSSGSACGDKKRSSSDSSGKLPSGGRYGRREESISLTMPSTYPEMAEGRILLIWVKLPRMSNE